MFVLSIIVYMITFSINNSFNLLNKNKEYSTMLNLAQNYMNETKNDIKYKNDKINTETIYLNKFQINKIITKKENYYKWNDASISDIEWEQMMGKQTLSIQRFFHL